MCALVTGVQTCALPILLLGSGMTRIGSHATSAAPAALAAVADVLNGAGLPTVVMDDIYAFVWAKLGAAGNMSSLSALTRLPIGPNSASRTGRSGVGRVGEGCVGTRRPRGTPDIS